MTLDEIRKILPTIPSCAGCYQYRNGEGEIIYVGKAKNLKKRIGSYFLKDHKSRKTARLVHQIRQVEYFIVENEYEALLLENNLIKTHQPRYNVLLKDDKSYPKIVVTHEPYPRIFVTRQNMSRGKVFGPYPHVAMAHAVWDVIRSTYQLRTCRLPLTEDLIRAGKYKVCLQYHIKKCDGVCEGLVSWDEYNKKIAQAIEVLRGDLQEVIQKEEEAMIEMSRIWAFEKAEEHKHRLETLDKYQSKYTVAPQIKGEVDVFGFDSDDERIFINMMHLYQGSVVWAHNVEIKKPIEESDEDLMATAITELRSRFKSQAPEVILSVPIEWGENPYKLTIPEKGDKKALLELSERNAKRFRVDFYSRMDKLNPEQRTMQLLQAIRQDLGLVRLPRRIECFDNSNLQGTHPVSACVVFINGKPDKKEYRKFHVKTVVGPNDYDTMREVIRRRYQRVLEEEKELPDLILIDGGKGQLGVAYETLSELGIIDRVDLRSLAERWEELYSPFDPDPLVLPRTSKSLKVMQHLRDEAHRFGIGFHRTIRSQAMTESSLDHIPGLGKVGKETLLSHFKTPKRVWEASENQLQQILGKKRGEQLYRNIHPEFYESSDTTSY